MSDWFLEALQACNELSQTWMESGKHKDLQISSLVRDKILVLVYGRKLNCSGLTPPLSILWSSHVKRIGDTQIEINMVLINIAKHNFPLPIFYGAKKGYIPSYVYVATDYLLAYVI